MADRKPEQIVAERIGYRFSDPQLLTLALTHRSASSAHNERLEFLGDAVLGFCTASLLYTQYPDATEGELSRLRAALVNRETLSALAGQLSLGTLLVLGAGERKSGGRQRPSILCDVVEAVLGAMYLDGGMAPCQAFVSRFLSEPMATGRDKDAKTALQEILQARHLPLPVYELAEIEGEEHEQTFVVCLRVALLKGPVTGRGRNRRIAEQQAAAIALDLLDDGNARPR